MKITSPISAPFDGTILITPSGRPASLNKSIIIFAEYTWVAAGFQITTFPIRAGAAHKFAHIEVKLNGVIAKTNPSSGLCSSLFHIPSADSGCSEYNFVTYWALNLKKSINSHAASISAWYTFFDWAIIVAALIFALYGPANNSAAFRKIATLWFHGKFDQFSFAANAFSIAISIWDFSARLNFPILCLWSWGGDISFLLSVKISFPPMYKGISIDVLYISL